MTSLIVAAAIVAILALGVTLRLKEPLSSPSLGAEDPYTHVVFTKEALERGWFGDSWYLGTPMYPPGLHALAGVLAPLSGIHLYDFARFAPVGFGALAILGTFVLASRLGGPSAGLAAALVTAIMPEHIFRTNLFFPTALDLAIVPAFLLLFWHAATSERRIGPSLAFGALSIVLAFTHPWLVPLFATPALVAVALTCVRSGDGAASVARRLVLPGALVALATAFAMTSRWTDSDTGFADFFAMLGPLGALASIQATSLALFLALSLLLGAVIAVGIGLACALATARVVTPRVGRVAIAAGLVVILLMLVGTLSMHPPQDVGYAAMLGRVAIVLALVGTAVALLSPTPLGDLGLSLSVLLFPLTAINIFHSQYWPSRTVAYLSVGVALLVGAAVSGGVRLALANVKSVRVRSVAAPAALLTSILLLGGAVATYPAHAYPWYHLYDDEEFAAFQRTADVVGTDPDARIVTSTWQPALLVKTLMLPSQSHYSTEFFKDAGVRAQFLASHPGTPKYVIVDKYEVKQAHKTGGDFGFLDDGSWEIVHETPGGSYKLYEWAGS
ncbi:MAG: hypothetical protein WDA16_05325 [Candidatus Thermoplasmatota archaeon]